MKFNWIQYLKNYPDLELAGINTKRKLINHYNEFGIHEGRTDQDLNPKQTPKEFNWKQYLRNYPDLEKNGIYNKKQLIYHYKHFGKNEGRTDQPLEHTKTLKLYDNSFVKDTEHRGGWKFIIDSLSKENILNDKSNIYLIDLPARTFIEERQIINKDFYVVIHETINILKNVGYQYNIDSILTNEYFLNSINYCKGIITFSNYAKEKIRSYNYNIPILKIKHPVLLDNIIYFDINKINFNNNTKIVLLGSQLRSIYNLYTFNTKKEKYMLPGTKKYLDRKIQHIQQELQKYNITYNSNIIKFKYFDSFNDFDKFITNNIIIIDLVDANANNSVVECIIRNIPFFVNKIKPIIEYLGKDYPMYFKNKEDLEIINDNKKLKELFIKTNNYLKNLNKSELDIKYFCKKLDIFINYPNLLLEKPRRINFFKDIDKIYIISLKHKTYRQNLLLKQLVYFNLIDKVEIFDAINSYDNKYTKLYNDIIKNMDHTFIKNNFTRGAFGCLLSHKHIILKAKQENYKKILILEDDCILEKNFDNSSKIINKLNSNWDFVYLGKKQYPDNLIVNKSERKIYNYFENENFTSPKNNHLFSSHAWLIKNTIFDDLLNEYNKFNNPVDLAVHNLYNKYNFYVLKNDLFITYLHDSDIQNNKEEYSLWNWNKNNYFDYNFLNIKNIYIWGFIHNDKDNTHTHSYIHQAIYKSFKYYYPYLNVKWVENRLENINYDNSLFFVSPTHGDYENLPINDKSLYIFHLDDFSDNLGITTKQFKNTNYYNLVLNNQAIILNCRQNDFFKYNDFSFMDRTINLNWGIFYDYKQILNIIKNKENIYDNIKNNEYICFFGSIWFLNKSYIDQLCNYCENIKQKLILIGRNHYLEEYQNRKYKYVIVTNFDDYNGKMDFYDFIKKYKTKAILAIQGKDHKNTYISDRSFKYPLDGFIAFTNNKIVQEHFPSIIYKENISELVNESINIMKNKKLYCNKINEQLKDVIKQGNIFKINKILNSLQLIFNSNKKTFEFDNINFEYRTILFSNKNNLDYLSIKNNDQLYNFNCFNTIKKILINNLEELDFGLIYHLINRSDIRVEISNEYENKNKVINNIYYKKYYIV